VKKYDYDAVHIGEWRKDGPGLQNFLFELNVRAQKGWKFKTILILESDSYVLLERESPDE
jgi:hypothetical protein